MIGTAAFTDWLLASGYNTTIACERFLTMRLQIGYRAVMISGLALFVAASAACGGGGAAGSDEDYVTAICEATSELTDVMFAAFTSDDEEKAEEAVLNGYEDFLAALERANPPSDMSDVHEQMVDGLDSAIETLKEEGMGGADAEAAFNALDVIEDPSAETQERLTKVAASIEGCEGFDLFDNE